MSEQTCHCPFYGIDEEICDVGCGYISPSDVSRIATSCYGSYRNCGRYGELLERNQVIPVDPSLPRPAHAPTGAAGILNLCGRFGLTGIAATLLALGLIQFDHTTRALPWLALLGLAGCGLQLLAGMSYLRQGRRSRAALHVPAALFFASLLGLHVLPVLRLIATPTLMATTVYSCLWILFAILNFSHLTRLRRSADGLPATIVLCALAAIVHAVESAAALAGAFGLGLIVVGSLYLLAALYGDIGTPATVGTTAGKPTWRQSGPA